MLETRPTRPRSKILTMDIRPGFWEARWAMRFPGSDVNRTISHKPPFRFHLISSSESLRECVPPVCNGGKIDFAGRISHLVLDEKIQSWGMILGVYVRPLLARQIKCPHAEVSRHGEQRPPLPHNYSLCERSRTRWSGSVTSPTCK